jgi:hypothetical protein
MTVAPIILNTKRVWIDEELFYRTYIVLIKSNDNA